MLKNCSDKMAMSLVMNCIKVPVNELGIYIYIYIGEMNPRAPPAGASVPGPNAPRNVILFKCQCLPNAKQPSVQHNVNVILFFYDTINNLPLTQSINSPASPSSMSTIVYACSCSYVKAVSHMKYMSRGIGNSPQASEEGIMCIIIPF